METDLLIQYQLGNLISIDNIHNDNKGKKKNIDSAVLNDTFANWKKIKREVQQKRNSKNKSKNQNFGSTADSSMLLPRSNGKNTYRGMTLEEYFKSKDETESKLQDSTRNNYHDEINDEKHYFQDHFQIHETDQENYSQTPKPVKTPQFHELPTIISPTVKQQLQSKLLNKYSKKVTKLKTESQEQQDNNLFIEYRSRQRSKKRFPTTLLDQTNPLQNINKSQLQQTFYKDQNRKNRIISNPIHKKQIKEKLSTLSDFYKVDHSKKKKILQKVKHQKQRVNDMRMNEIGFITKYATKFHINKSVCKQLLKQQQLRL